MYQENIARGEGSERCKVTSGGKSGWEEERRRLGRRQAASVYSYSGRTIENGKNISVTWAMLGPCLVIPVTGPLVLELGELNPPRCGLPICVNAFKFHLVFQYDGPVYQMGNLTNEARQTPHYDKLIPGLFSISNQENISSTCPCPVCISFYLLW